MGQAKLRGSREVRIKLAIEKEEAELKAKKEALRLRKEKEALLIQTSPGNSKSRSRSRNSAFGRTNLLVAAALAASAAPLLSMSDHNTSVKK